ncbi:MAG: DUF4251 domain-containing protein [Bacteroidia bacterium]|nr:DUF4251 domain-containing protein [Bacteroidia bacterium]NNF83180.1 DUF4251 domain-containing protein [Flavobacteriaceae bacterium]
MKKLILTVSLAFFVLSVGFGQTREERKALKEQEKLANFEEAKSLIESGSFSFVADWMQSRHGIQRRVINRLAYLRISDNNAEAYFPYFGIVRSGAAHDGGGIEFNDEMRDYQVSVDESNKSIKVSFKVSHKSEHYQVELRLIKGKHVNVLVQSNKRDSMDFIGSLHTFEE